MMRFLIAALALAGTGTALAHTPDTGFPGSFGHQLARIDAGRDSQPHGALTRQIARAAKNIGRAGSNG
jgi:hypothetical protein